MKLNKFFFGLLMTPAVIMVGCSDYEDTEVTSPEADADAIGAYFEKSSNSVKLLPGKTSFEITLNRATAGDAVTVPLKVMENKNNFFVLPVDQFVFEAGKQSSTPISVSFNTNAAVFQKNDTLGLQVLNGEKDHLYAAGYTDTEYAFVIDYTWKSDSLASTMVKDEYAGTFNEEGTLASVEIAKDFEEAEDKEAPDYTKNSLVRIPSFFASIGKTKKAGDDHIQFVVDKNHEHPQLFTTQYLAGKNINLTVNITKLETGMTKKIGEKEYPVCMDLKDIEVSGPKETTPATSTEPATENVTYQITYDLYAYDKDENKLYKVSDSTEGVVTYNAKFEVKFVMPSAEE